MHAKSFRKEAQPKIIENSSSIIFQLNDILSFHCRLILLYHIDIFHDFTAKFKVNRGYLLFFR